MLPTSSEDWTSDLLIKLYTNYVQATIYSTKLTCCEPGPSLTVSWPVIVDGGGSLGHCGWFLAGLSSGGSWGLILSVVLLCVQGYHVDSQTSCLGGNQYGDSRHQYRSLHYTKGRLLSWVCAEWEYCFFCCFFLAFNEQWCFELNGKLSMLTMW